MTSERCETLDWDGLLAKVRPMLPAGSVVLSPSQVKKIEEWRDAAEDAACGLTPSSSAYRRVLAIVSEAQRSGVQSDV